MNRLGPACPAPPADRNHERPAGPEVPVIPTRDRRCGGQPFGVGPFSRCGEIIPATSGRRRVFSPGIVAGWQLSTRSSGGFPTPAVIVFADNCFAITRHAGRATIIMTAVFARLVAVSPITQRVAACRRRRRWRRGCWRRRCCGCWRRRCSGGRRRGRCSGWRGPCGRPTCRARLRGHVRQRGRGRGVHVVTGVGCDVADLRAVTCAQPSDRYRILHGCQALVGGMVPIPFAAEPLRSRGNSGGDRADVDIA